MNVNVMMGEEAGGVGGGGRVLCSKREPTLDGVVGKNAPCRRPPLMPTRFLRVVPIWTIPKVSLH